MPIFPKTVLNKIETYYFIWITGENRSGKTALAVDLASYYLEAGFRFLSNLDCVFNDDFSDPEKILDPNLQLNTIVILDEGGVYMRTKESIRRVMGFKGKLNAPFLMPSTEAPHEDLWRNYIEPHTTLNEKLIIPLFGRWFYENIFKIWRFVSFDVKTGFKTSIFFQIFPKKFYGLYSTLSSGTSPENILQVFDFALFKQNQLLGNKSPLLLQDLVTKKTGASESQSFLELQNSSFEIGSKGKLFSSKKAR